MRPKLQPDLAGACFGHTQVESSLQGIQSHLHGVASHRYASGGVLADEEAGNAGEHSTIQGKQLEEELGAVWSCED